MNVLLREGFIQKKKKVVKFHNFGPLGLIYYFWPALEGFFILDVPNKHP